MVPDILGWPRSLRSEVAPAPVRGVYALFIEHPVAIPEFTPGQDGLIYIGKASGIDGFAGRCHFTGKTLDHSPRKSLAVLLMTQLALEVRGHGGRKWGLTPESDRRLSAWMWENIRIAFLPNDLPEVVEDRLIQFHSPPLNLKMCRQDDQHRRISRLRGEARARANISLGDSPADQAQQQPSQKVTVSRRIGPFGSDARIDSAPDIARRYHIDPKRLRGELRRRAFGWHILWNSWDVPRLSDEWRQIVEVAQELSGRNLGELD